MATDGWGVDDGWSDTGDRWHAAPPATLDAFAGAMGRYEAAEPPGRPVCVVRPGATASVPRGWALVLEDGTDLGAMGALPADLPLGLHELIGPDGRPGATVLVSPGRCHLPDDLREWGLTMQVPTTRSRSGWGVGDLADVRSVAAWLERLGGRALGLSPLHATTPVHPIKTSPYFPSSRRWRNPLLLRVDEVPGADRVPQVAALAAAARAGTASPILDRDRTWRAQRTALELIWREQPAARVAALARWRAANGDALEGWARYCALADEHGPRWSRWPAPLRRPTSAAVADAARSKADAIAFHAWLQLLLEEQLTRANTGEVRLVQDLAVGIDPDGADAWLHQDLLALDMSVGAPPDDFAPEGQDWGLPPFVPWRLRDAGYRPLAELFRASMAPGGGLRVDHVMGLVRLFWIPRDGSPADGTYVRFEGRELLEVLAMESARAGALVVGEDLGTVEPGFRDQLRATDILSTRLVWFEADPPEQLPTEALAMVTTHDLPTIAGVWTGADDAELASIGRPTSDEDRGALRRRLAAVAAVPDGAPVGQVVDRVHQRLAASPAALTLGTLEDLCEVRRRPNVPGTTSERPNWSRALPLPVEDLASDPAIARHARQLTRPGSAAAAG